MEFYFAPMEGITGYTYRNAYHSFFGNKIDKYFAPFINANQSDNLKSRERNDILPEHNEGIYLVPQLMTNKAKDFIHTAEKLQELGYDEINLNLGCPSKTVVSKYRGSGFLAKQKELNTFLEEIFDHVRIQVSIKTRIGKDDALEFYDLINIYNQYPLKELIIHPRVQADYYNNTPNLEVFADALSLSKNPVCYNGDIHSVKEYEALVGRFPSVNKIMLGRGLLKNPLLIKEIEGELKRDKIQLKAFHDRIYQDYQNVLFGEKNVLFKMKELWHYLGTSFTNHEKYVKKIKKAQRLCEYEAVVQSLFTEQSII